MEKFSIYDLLGLLLPGVLFVYFCNVLNSIFGVLKFSVTTNGWDVSTLILLSFALIAGAMLYAAYFLLIDRPWFKWLFGMKKHVAEIYLDLAVPFQSMNLALNKKAIEWYGNPIFFSKEELERRNAQLTDQEKNIQDDFYVRMYYELEYEDKIDSAKTLQSFYYFFRQTVTACLLLLGLYVILMIAFTFAGKLPKDMNQVIGMPILLILTAFFSAWHARWYRKSMVLKMYWAYFTHLNQPLNK